MRASCSIPQLLTVFAVAVAARLLFTFVIQGVHSWDDVDRGGELGRIAVNVAEGRGYSDPFGSSEDSVKYPTAWFSPITPMLWAFLFHHTGSFSTTSLYILLIGQAIVGGLVVLGFTHLFARFGIRHAFWGGVLFAIWPESLKLYAVPWYFVFQDAGMLAMVYIGLKWRQHRQWIDVCLLAVVTGAVLLVNPIPLLLFAWLLLAALWKHCRIPTMMQCAVAVLLVSLLLVPWAARNAERLEKAQPFRSNFGVELRQGNGARATLVQSEDSQHPALDANELQMVRTLGEAAYEDLAKDEAIRYMLADPVLTVQRTLIRVYLFWCSDLLDQYTWADRPPWWQQSGAALLQRLVLSAAAVSLPLLALIALARGKLFAAPLSWLFVGVVVLVPAPYYLTHVVALYPLAFKPYLLWWVFAAWMGQNPRRPQETRGRGPAAGASR